jgi:thiosulfate dehydrogenase (quinone)
VLRFDAGLYNYHRGSVLTPNHKGPVGATAHHFTPDGGALATWDWQALSALAPTAIANEFAYNMVKPAPYGLEAGVGARAVITLPPPANADATKAGAEVRITDVDGETFACNLPRPDG